MNPFTMRSKRLHLVTTIAACFIFFGCTKKTEDFKTAPLSDYLPLEVGKYITYRVDSTVFVNFGSATEIHSYQEKNVIDAKITDALGREGYRVFRFIRDTTGTNAWAPAGTYFIIPADKTIEVIENNLRFIKLALPIQQDFSWKGNRYLNDEPYASSYSFLNDDDMDTWDYTYNNINDVFNYQQQNLSDVVSVLQVDDRNSLDTVNVSANQATIPFNAESVWLTGNATDTIILSGGAPGVGHEYITVFNHSNHYASLNKIVIPPDSSLDFQFYNNKWYYPNPLNIVNNSATFQPSNAFVAYILGHATDTIKVNVFGKIDTSSVKKVKIYNKSDSVAVCNFNAAMSQVIIPPGYGRQYELFGGQWRLFENSNTLLDRDPYSAQLPFGKTNYSVEKYAKGIGLVYQELLMWEYQPPNGSNPNGYRNGFGVKRSIIDHN